MADRLGTPYLQKTLNQVTVNDNHTLTYSNVIVDTIINYN